MDIRRLNDVSSDESMLDIYTNTVIVTVVIDAVFFVHPASVSLCCNRFGCSNDSSGIPPPL